MWGRTEAGFVCIFSYIISAGPHGISQGGHIAYFLLGSNTIQKQPSGVGEFFWLRLSEVSAHVRSFVCVLLGPYVRLNIKPDKGMEEEIGYVMASRNQTEEGTIYNFRRHTSSDLLPPVSSYFLRLPELPQIAWQLRFKHLIYSSCGIQFTVKP